MSKSLFRKKSIAQIQADAAAGLSDHVQDGVGGDGGGLRRSLGTFDLTMLGIAAIVGAGIFALVGEASFQRRSGRCHIIYFRVNRLRFCRALLRGICVENSDCGFGLHLCLREFRRTDRVDHRLGFISRIRHRKYRRRDFVERLFYATVQSERH